MRYPWYFDIKLIIIVIGAHKNHDVGTVKKAYPVIFKQMEEKVGEVS